MAIQLLGHAMPDSMATVGALEFPPAEKLAGAGNGRVITATTRTATWSWVRLTNAEYDYLAQTVCLGEPSAVGGVTDTTTLNDPTRQRLERNFHYGVIEAPTYEKYSAGLYFNVSVIIRNLISYLE